MVKLTAQYRKLLEDWLKRHNIEPDTIDIQAEWDSQLSYRENKKLLAEKYNIVDLELEKDEYDAYENEHLREEADRTEKQLAKAIMKLKGNENEILNTAFSTAKELVKTLLKSENIHGLILKGEAGIGKSHLVMKTLSEEGLMLGKDYSILTGYATPLELYLYLYENRNKKVLVFDDIMKLFENNINKGILLSALFNPTGDRIVNYYSSTEKLTAPKTFEFKPKIIWCLNEIPQELEPIKSRCFYYEIKFDYPTKIKILYAIAQVKKIPFDIIDFIKENTNEAYQIDFRLPLKIYEIYKANPNNWKNLSLQLLQPKHEDLLIVKELMEKYATTKEQIIQFTNITGKSRATFFRYKRELMESLKVSSHTYG